MQRRTIFFRFYSSTLTLAFFVLLTWMQSGAQAQPEERKPANPGSEYSGMYDFLSVGDYLQLGVKDDGRVTGLISRYAESGGDGEFINHVFKSGQLDGSQLVFTTEAVQGVSFEFHGTIERGEGKIRSDEGYYVLKGTLVENTIDTAKKTSSRALDVALRSFPQDLPPPQAGKK
jgi:hypothetical protein